MIYNYYNRISTTRLVTKDRLTNTSIAISKIGNIEMKRELGEDELYDILEDVHNTRTYELTREEKYEYIRKQIEIHSELKDTIEKLCDNAIVPDYNGKFYTIDVSDITGEIKNSIIENDKKILNMLGFNNHINAWSTFFEWSSFGKVAYRIKYEYKNKDEIAEEVSDLKNKLGLIDVELSNGKVKLTESIKTKLNSSKNKIIKQISLLENTKYTKKPTKLTDSDKNDDYVIDEIVITDIVGMKKLNISYLEEKYYADDPTRKIYKYKNNFYDENEIIVIDYNYINGNNLPATRLSSSINDRKISYADSIIRSYNILNRIEISIVAWTVLNSMYRQKMVIPVMTKVAAKAKEAISKVRNKYLDNFEVDNNGNVRLNGETSFNYMKNIVLAERNGRKPEVETVQWSGWDIKNMEIVNYFRENFVRDGKIPSSRYSRDGNSGALSIYKADGVPYDEVSFYNYLDRILHQFSYLIKKPTIMLTKIQHPSVNLIDNIENNIKYKWESFSNFLEAKEAEKNTKILSNIDQMLRFTNSKREPLFDEKYLFVKRFGFMTEDEWKENQIMKQEAMQNNGSDGKNEIV